MSDDGMRKRGGTCVDLLTGNGKVLYGYVRYVLVAWAYGYVLNLEYVLQYVITRRDVHASLCV